MVGRVLASLVLGVLSGTAGYFLLPAGILLVGLLLFIAAVFVGYIIFADEVSVGFILLAVFLLAASGGLLCSHQAVVSQDPAALGDFVDETVSVTGEVTAAPERGGGQSVAIAIDKIAGEKLQGPVEAMLYAGSFPRLHYGDKIAADGLLSYPENFETDTGRLFNYEKYLAKDDIFYILQRPQVEIISRNNGGFVRQKLSAVRRYFSGNLTRTVAAPASGLARGVVLGEQGGLGEGLLEDFRDTGVVHVVVLSGFHVTIVSLIFFFLLRQARLSVRIASVGGVVAIVLFALMVGPTATVVRASIMAGVALFGRGLGRSTDAGRALTLAVLVMVLFNPYILLYDPSFQLSVIATAGLVYFGDEVAARLQFVPKMFGLRETITATVCAQIAVLPLLIYITGSVSVVSLLANILVLPVVPLLMLASAVTMLVAPIGPLAFAAGVGTQVLAGYVLSVVKGLASLPLASLSVGAAPLWLVFLSYLLLIAGWLIFTGRWRAALRTP